MCIQNNAAIVSGAKVPTDRAERIFEQILVRANATITKHPGIIGVTLHTAEGSKSFEYNDLKREYQIEGTPFVWRQLGKGTQIISLSMKMLNVDLFSLMSNGGTCFNVADLSMTPHQTAQLEVLLRELGLTEAESKESIGIYAVSWTS